MCNVLSILMILLPVTLFSASSSSSIPATAQPEIVKACFLFAHWNHACGRKKEGSLYTIILQNTGLVLAYRKKLHLDPATSKTFSTPSNGTAENKFIGTLNNHQGIPFDDVIDIDAEAALDHNHHTRAIRITTTHKDRKMRVTLWVTSMDGSLDAEVVDLGTAKITTT